MHNTLRHIVDATVSSSHLNAEEKDDLRKELMSHMHDYEHELQLRGIKEEQIARTIAESFGSPQEIGKQLYMVHKRFERIPLIGPLFYYTPVITSIRLFFSHVILFLGVWAMSIIVQQLMIFEILQIEIADRLLTHTVLPFTVIYSIAQGIWAQKTCRQFIDICEAILLSHLPIVLGYALYGFNRVFFQEQDWIGWQFVSMVILIHIGLMFVGVFIRATYQRYSHKITA